MGTLDQVLTDLAKTGVKLATEQVVDYLIKNVWVGFGYAVINPVVGWVVGFIISILMQKLDWLTYMLVENWQTTNEAKSYVAAATALAQIPPTASADEIKKAQDAKVEAFKRLIGIGSPPSH